MEEKTNRPKTLTGILQHKNTSLAQLNLTPEELTERFVRGDKSRHTKGRGLGLTIAKSLAQLQDMELTLTINGDLFCAEVLLQKESKEDTPQSAERS